MKILLLQDVRKIGKKHEVKDVSDGYARNFLLARKLAVPADAGAMKIKAEAEAKDAALLSGYRELAGKLSGDTLEFKVKTGPKGEVFGSVTTEQINKTLAERGYRGAEAVLDKPLRSLGEHKVEIDFGRGIKATARIILIS